MANLEDTDTKSALFVRSATRLTPVALVPEISLHQASDIYEVWEESERAAGRDGLPPPFWGVAWPGGQALARYLLDHPDLVRDRSVTDIGSGSGLVALAALRAGAATVIAVEPDPLARSAIGLNAAANALPAPCCVTEIAQAGSADVVVAGDVWYERELAEIVTIAIESAGRRGSVVLAGDIGRRYFPRRRYQPLASYEMPTTMALEGREVISATVWHPPAEPACPA